MKDLKQIHHEIINSFEEEHRELIRDSDFDFSYWKEKYFINKRHNRLIIENQNTYSGKKVFDIHEMIIYDGCMLVFCSPFVNTDLQLIILRFKKPGKDIKKYKKKLIKIMKLLCHPGFVKIGSCCIEFKNEYFVYNKDTSEINNTGYHVTESAISTTLNEYRAVFGTNDWNYFKMFIFNN